jgi:uncharacterized protein (DUF58 family)
MVPRELVRRLRQLQLRARRAVEDLLGGEYHSVFKGVGVAFAEVRGYLPGDDVRAIDWNVTARMGQPFVKRFVEERERTVLLLLDQSASLRFGTGRLTKRDVAAELAALLAFSALHNQDRVGLVAFTDKVERFVPPGKGLRHVLRLLRDVLCWQPERPGTSLPAALEFLHRVQRRPAIVFLFSDFWDKGFEKGLRLAGRRHDLIAVRLTDPREAALPPAGLVRVADAETGKGLVVDSGNARVRQALAAEAAKRRAALVELLRASRVDLLEVGTDGNHLQALVRFFQARERRARRG